METTFLHRLNIYLGGWDCTIMLMLVTNRNSYQDRKGVATCLQRHDYNYKQERTMAGKTYPWISQAAGHGEAPSY